MMYAPASIASPLVQLQIYHSRNAVRMRHEALQFRAVRPNPFVMIEKDVGLIAKEYLAGLRVKPYPLFDVRFFSRRLQQPIELRVAIATVVQRALAAEHIVNVLIGISEAGPSKKQSLVVSA